MSYMSISNSGQALPHRGSATHCALACPDIILEIIEQVSPPPWSSPQDVPRKARYDRRKALAALALSCRAFNVPATKVLWSRLDSFLPLLNLFHAFDGRQLGASTSLTYMFRGDNDILPQEVSRFRELGSFLQAIAPSDRCVCLFHAANPDVWHYLARLSGGKPLFPALRELHWAIRQPSSAEILFLLTPSLRRLTICYDDDNDEEEEHNSKDSREWELSQGMLFRTIYDAALLLEHLTLKDANYTLLTACLSKINVLQGLRALSLCQGTSISVQILRNLSSMASLEDLTFALDTDWLPEVVNISGFPALKKLDVNVMSGSIASARTYLTPFSCSGLRQLTFRTQNQNESLTLEEISTTCTLFAQRFPSLEDLKWSFLTRHAVPLDAALAPLFPLRIAKLSLELHGLPVTMMIPNDGVLVALGKAWPRLTALSVVVPDEHTERPGAVSSAKITAHGVLALARACPLLRTLRLPRLQAPRLEDVREFPLLRHGLHTFVVDHPSAAQDDEYTACALLVDRLFPEVDLDVEMGMINMYSGFGWKRVLVGVELCRLGRGNLALEG